MYFSFFEVRELASRGQAALSSVILELKSKYFGQTALLGGRPSLQTCWLYAYTQITTFPSHGR